MAAVAFAMTIIPTMQNIPAGARDLDRELAGLIRAVALGDQDAMSRLYDLTNRIVFGLTLRMLGDHATAEEVTLDVYVQVWRQASNYTPDRGKPISWLLIMARSRAIDRIRAARHVKHESEPLETALSFPAIVEDPEDGSIFAEQRRTIRAALSLLSPDQREAIELAYFSGLSQTEIAAKLGLPLGTIKTRTRSALMKLRQSLKNRQD